MKWVWKLFNSSDYSFPLISKPQIGSIIRIHISLSTKDLNINPCHNYSLLYLTFIYGYSLKYWIYIFSNIFHINPENNNNKFANNNKFLFSLTIWIINEKSTYLTQKITNHHWLNKISSYSSIYTNTICIGRVKIPYSIKIPSLLSLRILNVHVGASTKVLEPTNIWLLSVSLLTKFLAGQTIQERKRYLTSTDSIFGL